jgi:lipopolysaccharide transport system permease protein
MRFGMLRALWAYRGFVRNMVAREFRARYTGSLLGAGWALITPLLSILVYLVIFSELMKGRMPGAAEGDNLAYGIYLCTGIFAWGFFAEVTTRSLTVFLEFANLLKKLAFPRITLPVVVLCSAALNFAMVAVVFLALLVVTGRFPGWSILALVPLLAIQQAIATGLGVALGTLNVFFRDVGSIMGVVMNLWFWATPIVYHPDTLPAWAQPVLAWNPLSAVYRGYHRAVLEGGWPEWGTLLYPLLVAAAALLLARVTFRALSGDLVDEL